MNYYNPYFGFPNVMNSMPTSQGLLRGMLSRGINWSTILNNTQRTLGIINQAIPVVKQMSPIVNNAKTMFRVMNEFKRIDAPKSATNKIDNQDIKLEKQTTPSKGPTFFA